MKSSKSAVMKASSFYGAGRSRSRIRFLASAKDIVESQESDDLALLWYHGVNMTPGLFDRLNIPNFEIISFHLALYFLCRFFSTVSIHSILILMLPFLYILHFICLRSY